MPDSRTINISTSTILRFIAIILSLAVLYIIRDIVFSLFFAVIVASAIEPAIGWLKRYSITRIPAVLLVYVLIGAAVAVTVYLILPLVIEDIQMAASNYSSLQTRFLGELQRIGDRAFGPSFVKNLEELFSIPVQSFSGLTSRILNTATEVFGGVFSFILVIIFSFYLAAQEKGIENFLRMVTPVKHEPYVIDLWNRAQRKLGRWLRAQMLLGAIVGIFIFIGLTVLGIRQAFLFALLAAAFEIIPVVGPILAAVPAVAVAFLISPLMGLLTVALYVGVQQLESHVIIPIVMRKAVGLSPLVVVIALLVGAKLGGIFGILLAVPITAIAAEVIGDWDKKRRTLIPE